MSSEGEDNNSQKLGIKQFPECRTRGYHILYAPQQPVLDIIFIHGLNGDSYKTWCHKKSKLYWPKDILPHDLRKARIITYGFDAHVAKLAEPAAQTNSRIEADLLFRTVTNKRNIDETNDRDIIWIAHGLGGIMLKKALHLSTQDTEDFRKQFHHRTVGIMFIGTPHKGLKLASPVSASLKGARVFARTNVKLVDILKMNSALLDEYHHTFLAWLRDRQQQGKQLMLINYFETLEYKGAGMIVRQESAIMDDYPSQPIYAKNKNMVKFESKDDLNYQLIRDELLNWMKFSYARTTNTQTINQHEYKNYMRQLTANEVDHPRIDMDPRTEDRCQWIINHN